MTAALIIAAGQTKTSQGFEPMKRVGGISAVERLILVFQLAGVDRVVVVGGPHDEGLEKHVAHKGVVFLRNEDENAEMLHSVKLGVAYLDGKCSRALITPVDVPLISAETIRRLMGANEPVSAPYCNGRPGHPLMLSAQLFPLALNYMGAGGLSAALRQAGMPPARIEVSDEGVSTDIQKQADYEPLIKAHSLGVVHPKSKLYLAKEVTFFGPGAYQLLSLVSETQSMRAASMQMGISYSKAWKIIETMQHQLGFEVVSRKRGGREKGRTEITQKGRALLVSYRAYIKECNTMMQTCFEKHFQELLL
ncbi:MAG: NTP transferase domain-containing protein [Clostridiales bacterium]|nr:NTP transferase domain-containing protein [Clostridiales bacterium]